jgi:hypothetical protein
MPHLALTTPSHVQWVALVCGGYLLTVIVSRRFLIGVPAHVHFEQRRSALLAEAVQAGGTSPSDDNADRADPATTAYGLLEQAQAVGGLVRPFLPIGRLAAGWRLIHEAERHLVRTWPPEQVAAEMTRRGLSATTVGNPPNDNVNRERLISAMAASHETRDTAYACVARSHRLALFLVLLLGLLLPLVAALAAKPAIVLLGACGGLLSRAIRISRSEKPVASGYGLHWSAVFLAPLVGATAAAMGTLIVAGSTAAGLTGDTFRPVCTDLGWQAEVCGADNAAAVPTTTTAPPSSTTTAATPVSSCRCDPPPCTVCVATPTSTTSATTTRAATTVVPATVSPAPPTSGEPDEEVLPQTATTAPLPWQGMLHQVLSPIAAALALAFGFSERFFLKWIDRTIEGFDPSGTTTPTPSDGGTGGAQDPKPVNGSPDDGSETSTTKTGDAQGNTGSDKPGSDETASPAGAVSQRPEQPENNANDSDGVLGIQPFRTESPARREDTE